MNKKNLILLAAGGGTMILVGAFLLLTAQPMAVKPVAPGPVVAPAPPVTTAAITAPPIAGTAPPQPVMSTSGVAVVVPPVAAAPVVVTPTVPGAVVSPMSLIAPPLTPVLTTEQQELNADLSQQLTTQFNGRLSFPLTEAKMLAFTQLANKVKKINDRWDVLVASADTDKMAIEYNNMAVSDITAAIKNTKGITLEEYNELTKFAAQDKDFNRLYVAYRDMLAERLKPPVVMGSTPVNGAATSIPSAMPVTPPVVTNGQMAPGNYGQPMPVVQQQPAALAQPLPNTRQTGTGQPVSALPSVATTPGINPVAVPASPDIAPAPPGSPVPSYAQPASR